jgi:hypothetical protein
VQALDGLHHRNGLGEDGLLARRREVHGLDAWRRWGGNRDPDLIQESLDVLTPVDRKLSLAYERALPNQ